MGKREVTNVFKLMAPGGTATPAPPLGLVQVSKGVITGQFIQKFNAATAALKGKIVGCIVTVYSDRTFDFEVKSSPASVLIREAAKIDKGSGVPNKNKVGKISKAQVAKIAQEKLPDLNTTSLDAAMRVIEGTARSMGVTIEG